MFSLISGYLNYYLQQPTFKFLIIGEEKSGKSVNKKFIFFFNKKQTYLEQLKFIYTGKGTPLDYILPTSGLNRKFYI